MHLSIVVKFWRILLACGIITVHVNNYLEYVDFKLNFKILLIFI